MFPVYLNRSADRSLLADVCAITAMHCGEIADRMSESAERVAWVNHGLTYVGMGEDLLRMTCADARPEIARMVVTDMTTALRLFEACQYVYAELTVANNALCGSDADLDKRRREVFAVMRLIGENLRTLDSGQ